MPERSGSRRHAPCVAYGHFQAVGGLKSKAGMSVHLFNVPLWVNASGDGTGSSTGRIPASRTASHSLRMGPRHRQRSTEPLGQSAERVRCVQIGAAAHPQSDRYSILLCQFGVVDEPFQGPAVMQLHCSGISQIHLLQVEVVSFVQIDWQARWFALGSASDKSSGCLTMTRHLPRKTF